MSAPRERPTTLVVEDDDGLRPALADSFANHGHPVLTARSASEAAPLLRNHHVPLVVLDLHLPDGSGLDVLKAALEVDDDTVVVMMTAYPEVRSAVRAMREGAADFVVKPFELEELQVVVDRALEVRSLKRSVRRLDRERRRRQEGQAMVGESAPMRRMREQIERVAETDAPVLIAGETGTGKELVADTVHRLSPRSAGPLVKTNCGAVPEHLLESELFGHERGAFTDARASREGLFEMAHAGTLFLDEISEMRPELQTKLLRVVEGHPFRRVGGRREIRADVRIVAATNRNLTDRIRSGDFREDLYFRLNVFQIEVPPLRERGEDVVRLARFFLDRSAAALRGGALELSDEASAQLLAYAWPGNVRELGNVMERAAIVCDGDTVGLEHLPRELQASSFVRRRAWEGGAGALPSLEEVVTEYVDFVRRHLDGNLTETARVLGIARNTLKAKLRKAGLLDD